MATPFPDLIESLKTFQAAKPARKPRTPKAKTEGAKP